MDSFRVFNHGLCKKGEDAMTEEDWTLIFSAILDENLGALEQITIPLNDHDNSGLTPLLLAIDGGSAAIVSLLLSKGADANYLNRRVAYSALYVAVEARRMDLVRLLLEAGADPDLSFPGLSSARELAKSFGLLDYLTWFDSTGAKTDTSDPGGLGPNGGP